MRRILPPGMGEGVRVNGSNGPPVGRWEEGGYLYIPLGGVGETYSGSCMSDNPAPWLHPAPGSVSPAHACRAEQRVKSHQAQEGETPWVGASLGPPGPKGVSVDRNVCAELLRSS